MRRPLVAGNWKMNLNLAQIRELVTKIRDGLEKLGSIEDRIDVAICPPALYLFPLAKYTEGGNLKFGAQDVFHESSGAYTGELSAPMIAETGASYVILGHSERRHTIGHLEDDQMINRKVRAAYNAGMTPILCVGETLAERKAEKTLEVLTFQLVSGLIGIDPGLAARLVVAYEPVWAIGTGLNATPEQAQQAHEHLRSEFRKMFGDAADGQRILYGGSVKPDNARELMSQPDVDGGLIGGASLKADSFLGIIEATLAAKA